MELIPAIDVLDGKCVRLEKGDFKKISVYNNDPLQLAKLFEDAGIKRLHIVDLDGANGKPLHNITVLETIANATNLIIDFGGGLKETKDIHTVLNTGASVVSLGSIIIKSPGLFNNWVNNFGAEKFLPGADVLNKKIKINGWKENTDTDIFEFIQNMMSLDIDEIFCTDISKDGMMEGPSFNLYKEILSHFTSLQLIASGGISCYDDLSELKKIGCAGAIIGKAFYENKITLKQIESFIKNN